MNVKPGDLAKFVKGISPPHWEGVQCLVVESWLPTTAGERLAYWQVIEGHGSGAMWHVKVLESVRAKGNWVPPVGEVPAGCMVAALDRFLRKIEPPEDWQEVFDERPVLELIVLSDKELR